MQYSQVTCADIQSALCIDLFVTSVQQNDEVTVLLPFGSTLTKSLYPCRGRASVIRFALMAVYT